MHHPSSLSLDREPSLHKYFRRLLEGDRYPTNHGDPYRENLDVY